MLYAPPLSAARILNAIWPAWPRAFACLAHRIRQRIEVVNAQLHGQFAIERTLAKTLWSLVTRVQAKLTSRPSSPPTPSAST